MELNQERIENGIIQEVADNIINEEHLNDRVRKEIDSRINKLFAETAEKQIEQAITKAIKDGFSREYQKVTSWGEPVGEKTTISAQLERVITGYWNTPVDKNGKPSGSSYDTITRAEWTMMQLCSSDFHGHMKQHAINMGGAMKDILRDNLREQMDKVLSDIFHVKSLGDQGKTRINDRSSIDPPANPLAGSEK